MRPSLDGAAVFRFASMKNFYWRLERMSTLKEREEAFERKFAHDEETKFKIISRRNRLLGVWAAKKLGKDPEAYVSEVIKADLREKGDEDVFRKIRADFDAAGISISDEEIRTRMVDLLTEATNQINPQD